MNLLFQKLRDTGFRLLPYRFHRVLHALRYYCFTPRAEKHGWNDRIESILNSPDWPSIPKVDGAGTVRQGVLTMHNGVKVLADSYFGIPGCRMFRATKGIHEPQEETVFGAVLPYLRPGGVMLELGAYWGFYSLWFQQVVAGGKCYLVEPDSRNLDYGKKNFDLNQAHGEFLHAFISEAEGLTPDGVPITAVDALMNQFSLDQIDLLHCDIQGYELEMLRGATAAVAAGCIQYFFVSTHSDQLHADCEKWLVDHGLTIFCSVPPRDSFSVDGILVARRPEIEKPLSVDVARKAAG